MALRSSMGLAFLLSGWLGVQALAQTPMVPAVATVNGQPIPETAVKRALRRIPAAEHAKARPEILDYLIDNVLVDQYLIGLKVNADPAKVEQALAEFKSKLAADGQKYEDLLDRLQLTEPEFRKQIAAQLRWETFLDQQAPEAKLQPFFEGNKVIFDGTRVRARHILVSPDLNDPQAVQVAADKLNKIKQSILVAASTATPDPLEGNDKSTQTAKLAKQKAMEKAFAEAAQSHSACPSKKQGGDLSWFPRMGTMVEPFAKAAFALEPYEMSEPVQTEFGLHLIMLTGRQPGTPIEFTQVKDAVKDYYGYRLREAIIAKMRPKAKLDIQK